MRTKSTAAATNTNAEKSYAGPSFTIESGLSTDEILSKSDSSSASVWEEFESEKINYSQTQLSKRQKEEKDYDKDKDYAKVIKAPGAVLTVKSSKNLEVLCTSENIGVIIAVVSQTTTARDVLDFYSPLAKSNVDVDIGTDTNVRRSIGNNTEMTNKERTEFLREFLCGCAKRGSFSLIIYDAHSGRTCAARTAASPKLFFGFDIKNGNSSTNEEGKRGLCVSTDEKSLENVDLSILPSGRFIYGRQYVKPMEFTQFWSTAPAKQNSPEPRLSGDSINSALSKEEKIINPANTKSNSVVQTTPGSKQGVESNGPYTPDSGIKNDFMKAMRYAPTGSKADLRDVWNAGRGASADINPEEAKKIQKQVEEISKMSNALKRELINNKNKIGENTTTKTRMAENDNVGPPLKKISIDRAYRPPSMRKEIDEKKQKNSEVELHKRQLAESLGHSLTHALMRTSEDRLSRETMQSLTEFHTAIANKKKESKESEVQQMSSFFASSSIPENKST